MFRRIFITIFALFGVAFGASAQFEYEPTTTWPYAYPDFVEGTATFPDGAQNKSRFNIHLSQGRLHYLDGDEIKETGRLEVQSVLIGEDLYMNVRGQMMKVLASCEEGFVADEVKVDMTKLNATGGAYGSSSTTLATMASSSVEGIPGLVNINHTDMKNRQKDGAPLPTLSRYYIVVPKTYVFAGRKDIMELPGLDKNAFKQFLKENKIRWRDPESLLSVVKYLNENY